MTPSDETETDSGLPFAVAPPAETLDAILRRLAEDAADDRPLRRGRPQQHVTQRLRAAPLVEPAQPPGAATRLLPTRAPAPPSARTVIRS